MRSRSAGMGARLDALELDPRHHEPVRSGGWCHEASTIKPPTSTSTGHAHGPRAAPRARGDTPETARVVASALRLSGPGPHGRLTPRTVRGLPQRGREKAAPIDIISALIPGTTVSVYCSLHKRSTRISLMLLLVDGAEVYAQSPLPQKHAPRGETGHHMGCIPTAGRPPRARPLLCPIWWPSATLLSPQRKWRSAASYAYLLLSHAHDCAHTRSRCQGPQPAMIAAEVRMRAGIKAGSRSTTKATNEMLFCIAAATLRSTACVAESSRSRTPPLARGSAALLAAQFSAIQPPSPPVPMQLRSRSRQSVGAPGPTPPSSLRMQAADSSASAPADDSCP